MSGIAVLGWGSLIWDRDKLPIALPDDHKWHENGPIVPLEFVRQSQEGHLTLVIWEGGTPIKVRWAPLKVTNLNEAILALREREGRPPPGMIKQGYVGVWSRGAERIVRASISQWAEAMPLDHVIWTALPSKWSNEGGVLQDNLAPTQQEAVAHLEALVREGKAAKAEEYVQKAPEWVRTPYRRAFERELDWTHKP